MAWKMTTLVGMLMVAVGCGKGAHEGAGAAATPAPGAEDAGSGGVASVAGKQLFITSGTFSANLRLAGNGVDGADGADKLCNAAAQGAGLQGTFKAWLSTTTVSAVDRIADVGPWYQHPASGTPIKTFNNRANLMSTALAPIEVDEFGRTSTIGGFRGVWTGTGTGGRTATSRSCIDFSSDTDPYFSSAGTAGDASSMSNWTESTTRLSCRETLALYCFEQ